MTLHEKLHDYLNGDTSAVNRRAMGQLTPIDLLSVTTVYMTHSMMWRNTPLTLALELNDEPIITHTFTDWGNKAIKQWYKFDSSLNALTSKHMLEDIRKNHLPINIVYVKHSGRESDLYESLMTNWKEAVNNELQ